MPTMGYQLSTSGYFRTFAYACFRLWQHDTPHKGIHASNILKAVLGELRVDVTA